MTVLLTTFISKSIEFFIEICLIFFRKYFPNIEILFQDLIFPFDLKSQCRSVTCSFTPKGTAIKLFLDASIIFFSQHCCYSKPIS